MQIYKEAEQRVTMTWAIRTGKNVYILSHTITYLHINIRQLYLTRHYALKPRGTPAYLRSWKQPDRRLWSSRKRLPVARLPWHCLRPRLLGAAACPGVPEIRETVSTKSSELQRAEPGILGRKAGVALRQHLACERTESEKYPSTGCKPGTGRLLGCRVLSSVRPASQQTPWQTRCAAQYTFKAIGTGEDQEALLQASSGSSPCNHFLPPLPLPA